MPRPRRSRSLRISTTTTTTTNLLKLMIYIDTYGLRVTSHTCKVIASCYLDTTSLILLLSQGSLTTPNVSVSPPNTWTSCSTVCEAPYGSTGNERSEAGSLCASFSDTSDSKAMLDSFARCCGIYFLPPSTGDCLTSGGRVTCIFGRDSHRNVLFYPEGRNCRDTAPSLASACN